LHTASLALLGVCIFAAAIAGASQVLMMRAIQGELGKDGNRDEVLRVIYVLFQIHRKLFPASNLRVIAVGGYLIALLSAIGFYSL
jgi:hypothetical protein